MWLEFKVVFDTLSLDSDVRAIVLSGAGDRALTAGLDVAFASQQGGILKTATNKTGDIARKAAVLKRDVEEFQNCIGSVEKCEKRMSLLNSIGLFTWVFGEQLADLCC
jgi:delta(3,5)-delta(2,4)-dienoyl-CoA isomerase